MNLGLSKFNVQREIRPFFDESSPFIGKFNSRIQMGLGFSKTLLDLTCIQNFTINAYVEGLTWTSDLVLRFKFKI